MYDNRYDYGEEEADEFDLSDPQTYALEERLDLLVKAGALIAAEIDRLQRAAVQSRELPRSDSTDSGAQGGQ